MRDIEQALERLAQQNLRRSLRWIDQTSMSTIHSDGRELVNFASNDYLGLSQHPAAIEAMAKASQKWGVGSGASRLITGSQEPHRKLEEFIATQKQHEAALTFSSGYTTAIGTLSSLLEKEDIVIVDKLCHASLIDGARISGATLRVFPHNDTVALEKLLKKIQAKRQPGQRVLIVTESVFSMDGDICPIQKIVTLKKQYDCLLLLDEAHGLGVLGERGLGLAEQTDLQKEIDIHMGTLSKSAGTSGGYIASSRNIIDLLINKARSFIYSTAPPAAIADTALTNLKTIISKEGKQLRKKLEGNFKLFATELNLPAPQSAIVPIIAGTSDQALTLSESLLKEGFLAPAIRYPTVPRNTARLRITFSALHSTEQIQSLCNTIKNAG